MLMTGSLSGLQRELPMTLRFLGSLNSIQLNAIAVESEQAHGSQVQNEQHALLPQA